MSVQRKISIINFILIVMMVICLLIGGLVILLSKTSVVLTERNSNEMNKNYSITEESNNTWDVSKNGDRTVMATLTEDGTLTISGTGEMKDWNGTGTTEWHEVKEKVKNVVIENGITSIGEYAFKNCNNLTSIEIPEGVTSIGRCAFNRCENLTNIEIPKGVKTIQDYTFGGCSSLTSIEIPSSVTKIGGVAFSGCENLTSISIPDGVTSIGWSAFSGCENLTNIEIPKGVKTIEADTFSRCSSLISIKIPEGVTSIGSYAFYYCVNLINIEIPKGVTSIGAKAFEFCLNLTNMEIPNSVTSVGDNAFKSAEITKLADIKNNVELPDFLKRAQDQNDILYWGDGYELTNCTIEGTAIKINQGNYFAKIKVTSGKLKGMRYVISDTSWDISKNGDGSVVANLSDDRTLIISGTGDMKQWSGIYGTSEWFAVRKIIKNVVIESGVTNIGKNAFYNCKNLTSIEILESVISIGYGMVDGCAKLENIKVDLDNTVYMDVNGVLYAKDKNQLITYPSGKKEEEYVIEDGTISIEEHSFLSCGYLKNIKIPSSVTNISEFWLWRVLQINKNRC